MTSNELVSVKFKQLEDYERLKKYHCDVSDNYGQIHIMVFRLLMLSELLNSGCYEKKEIENDIIATVFDLYHYCEKYEALIKSYDDGEI